MNYREERRDVGRGNQKRQDVTIRGFTLEAGPGGDNDIDLNRAQNFSVRNNVMTGPSTVATVNQGIGPVGLSRRHCRELHRRGWVWGLHPCWLFGFSRINRVHREPIRS